MTLPAAISIPQRNHVTSIVESLPEAEVQESRERKSDIVVAALTIVVVACLTTTGADLFAGESVQRRNIQTPFVPVDNGVALPFSEVPGRNPANYDSSQVGGSRIRRTEISTGRLLNQLLGGDRYEPRWFYVRLDGGDWRPTYDGPEWNPSAGGKLMNFRASRAVTNDEQLPDDVEQPDRNTDEVIANLEVYRQHGILMLTVGLQTHRVNGYGSAFNPDGSLKSDWTHRLARLIEAANRRGMVIQIYLFFQGHDQDFRDEEAIRRAVRDFVDWLIARDFRNVIIEIANEYNHAGFDYDLIGTDSGVAELIQLAQSRFSAWRLPVTTSSATRRFPRALWDSADITLIHGNNSPPEDDIAAVRELVVSGAPGPVVMNEDDNTKLGQAERGLRAGSLDLERGTASGIFLAGGSWGMMVEDWNQVYPYRWSLGESPGAVGNERQERAANYVAAILIEIQQLTRSQAAAVSAGQFFPETGYHLASTFQSFWERNGGLAIFGYPVSGAHVADRRVVQYLERQRFEEHVEATDNDYRVQLGRLGAEEAQRRRITATPWFDELPVDTASDGHCQFVATTRHRLCAGFRDYWIGHGLDLGDPATSFRESVALFGYPLSEEFHDPDTGRTVQYFERAVFEYHPENQAPYRVLLARLGAALTDPP